MRISHPSFVRHKDGFFIITIRYLLVVDYRKPLLLKNLTYLISKGDEYFNGVVHN